VRFRLAPGSNIEQAIALLGELATNAYSVGAMAAARGERLQEYVQWATNTERRLRGVLARPEAEAFFDQPRHRDICQMGSGAHVTALIAAEVEARALDFRELADYMEQARNKMRSAPGCLVVLDTNVLLQCMRPDQLDWTSEIGETVRVMVPLRVIEEIDAKKYGDNQRLRSVARALLPWIDSLFPDGRSDPVPIRDGVTFELLLTDRPRDRPDDADEEVLDVAHEVHHLAGRVKLMTGDTGMRIRARSESLDVLVLPDGWRRSRDSGAGAA
jgi:rRNA-processing protein FCF1